MKRASQVETGERLSGQILWETRCVGEGFAIMEAARAELGASIGERVDVGFIELGAYNADGSGAIARWPLVGPEFTFDLAARALERLVGRINGTIGDAADGSADDSAAHEGPTEPIDLSLVRRADGVALAGLCLALPAGLVPELGARLRALAAEFMERAARALRAAAADDEVRLANDEGEPATSSAA